MSQPLPHESHIGVFEDLAANPPVRGFLHRPDHANGGAFVLAHSAGGNAQSPLLVTLGESFCDSGFFVLRAELPFRQAHPGPPRPGENVLDRQGLENAVSALRKIAPGKLFLGGHSYGGRQSSMLCAEKPEVAAGLLLLSYPLHPPRQPAQRRIQHLPKLHVPTLFVHGTRDPFGSIKELDEARQLIPAKAEILPVEGAGHDLGFARGKKPEALAAEIVRKFLALAP